MPKKSCFRTLFDSQHLKEPQTLLKSAQKHYYHIFSSLWDILSLKMSLFVIFEISGLFVKTLIPHDKYSLRYMENLPQPIQMELSRKQKFFPHFFFCISEIYIKFWTSWNKDKPHSLYISEIRDYKRRV